MITASAPRYALRDAPQKPERAKDHDERVTSAGDERGSFRCRTCGRRIASRAALMSGGDTPLVFANPHGTVFEIVRLREAVVTVWGEPTTDATWFSGYAWRVALCGGCHTHIGWRYDSVQSGLEPSIFFGLLRDRLVEARDNAD